MSDGLGILLLAFAIATTIVAFWRVILAMIIITGFAVFLVGVFQVVSWFQASS